MEVESPVLDSSPLRGSSPTQFNPKASSFIFLSQFDLKASSFIFPSQFDPKAFSFISFGLLDHTIRVGNSLIISGFFLVKKCSMKFG